MAPNELNIILMLLAAMIFFGIFFYLGLREPRKENKK